MWFWGLNLGPCADKASTLLTEPSLQPSNSPLRALNYGHAKTYNIHLFTFHEFSVEESLFCSARCPGPFTRTLSTGEWLRTKQKECVDLRCSCKRENINPETGAGNCKCSYGPSHGHPAPPANPAPVGPSGAQSFQGWNHCVVFLFKRSQKIRWTPCVGLELATVQLICGILSCSLLRLLSTQLVSTMALSAHRTHISCTHAHTPTLCPSISPELCTL